MRQALYCVNCANVSSQELYEIRSIIIIVSLMQELKHREAEWFANGHTASTMQKQDRNPGD